jgi:2-polyprenyl-6-methoxyphenol hydroxylase-like FAD-dependent oxidoreductase
MAMMDAFCLGRLLARDDISVAEAFLQYEEKRKSSAERIVKTSSFAGRMYTATGVKAMLRNIMLPFSNRILKAELAEDPTA